MLERGKMDRDLVEFVVIDQLVPKAHLLRKIDAAVDFTQLYEMVEPLYCEDNGRPSIDPVVLFKMVLIQHLYGLPSLRRTAEEVSANNCYRWFLGYPLQEETPHFSTVSYNFRHRFTEETVDRVFAWILDEAAKAGYLCRPYYIGENSRVPSIHHLYGSNTYCRIHKSVIRMEYVHNTHCENPPRSNRRYILKIYFLTYTVYCSI